jgi:hypothetical protein
VTACGARAVLAAGTENATEVVCSLPDGHRPADVHQDQHAGPWSEDEVETWHP